MNGSRTVCNTEFSPDKLGEITLTIAAEPEARLRALVTVFADSDVPAKEQFRAWLLLDGGLKSGERLREQRVVCIRKNHPFTLYDSMREAFQKMREYYWRHDQADSYRIAAMAIAIEMIAVSYQEMGVYP